nr:hypothetical protein [Tanacetum cinerariifolium]
MAHQQIVADVHPDELCPPNKRIAASSSVPWIYMEQFWHTLKEDGSKYMLKFMLDRKELSLTLDDFRTIFHLPQATDNNHDSFVPPPSFYDMISFYKNHLGFTMELKTPSSFKITGLLQSWKMLCNIFSKCLTTRVTEWDQPPLQIMQMLYRFINNIHVDYVELLWVLFFIQHLRFYVPLIQSSSTESTQGTHRTPSVPRRVDIQDTLQVSLAEHKSRQEQEARENIALVEKHLASEEIEKMVEGQEHVVDDSSILRNDEHNIPGTRLEPRSDKENSKVGITDVMVHVNVYDEKEDEITDEVYKLKRKEKGKNVEESGITPILTPIRSPRIHTDLDKFMPRKSFVTLADHLHEAMADSLPTMVDKHIKEQVEKQDPEQVRNQVPVNVAKGLILERQKTKEEMEKMTAKAIIQEHASIRSYMSGHILHVHPAQPKTTSVPEQQCQLYLSMKDDPQTPTIHQRDQDDPHDDAHLEGENSAKRQKTSEYGAYVSGESSSRHDNDQEQGPSTSGNQEQADDYDFWTDSYASDDDEIPTKQVSQDIMKEMKNFLKRDIVWESRKEILVSPHPRKTTPLVLSCQRDPEAPALSLINQDLLYLKKGNLRPEKIVLSLYKFPIVVFNDDDIKERTSRWVNKANDCIVSITEPNFKNIYKNDIGEMYLLIINGKVPDYVETGLLWSLSVFIKSLVIWEKLHDFQLGIKSYQQKINLTALTISFPEVEKHEMFSIIYEHVHGIIYKNSKNEKKVMRHSKIHMFCDATLNKVLEGLKSYNNDVRYGYNQKDPTKDEVEYLKLFEEDIKDRLKYRRQMRMWESYVNGRPLGQRRERPE